MSEFQSSRISRRRCLMGSLLLLGAASEPARAAALAKPVGKVILSITGKISVRNAGERADFDMDMLAALPEHRFSTRTPWDKTVREFTGPLLRDLMAAVGAQGETIRAIALNDYKVDIPFADCREFDMVLARLVDGQPMRVRDRGPLFIVYPYDSNEKLRAERYYNRSAWQLRGIEVL